MNVNDNRVNPNADAEKPAEQKPTLENPVKTNPTEDQQEGAKPQTAKPPAAKVEDKPFETFIRDDFLPNIKQALTERGMPPSTLELIQGDRPVVGDPCWMVCGEIPLGRRFWLCFASDSIASKKTISLAETGTEPSLLEPFLIDEKKMTLTLLRSRLLQRLNGQKWLTAN